MLFFSEKLLILPYNKNAVVAEWTSAISTSITLRGDGIYEVTAVSGGGGGLVADGGTDAFTDTAWAWHYYTSGSTGAYYKGLLRLQAITYSINVGGGGYGNANHQSGDGGQTSMGSVLVLSGGQGSGQDNGSFTARGAGGALTACTTEVSRIAYNAGYGQWHHGSGRDWYTEFGGQLSPAYYAGVGNYGSGGGCHGAYYGFYGENGGSGYLKIVYKGAY